MKTWCHLPTIIGRRNVLRVAGLLSMCVALTTTLLFANTSYGAADINRTINFQGRLLDATGGVVPDGYYNVQFKIYQDGSGQLAADAIDGAIPAGTLKWTETYVNNNAPTTNGVLVKNGFMSVNLGSKTPFGSSVDWNQDTLWLSMNIAGSASACTTFNTAPCAADGEMLPMRKMTASPYALNSGLLNGLSSSNFVQLAQAVQTDASAVPSIFINKTNATGNLLELQNTANDVFTVGNTGDLTFGSTVTNHNLTVATAAASTAGTSLTIGSGSGGSGSGSAGGDLLLQGGGAGGTNANGGNVKIDAGTKTGTGTTGSIKIGSTNNSTVQIGSVGASGTQAINIGNDGTQTSSATTNVTIGAGSGAAGGTTTIQSKGNTTIATNGTTRATFDTGASTAGSLTLGSGLTGAVGTFTVQGTGGTAGLAGSNLTFQGGTGGTGTGFVGGNATIQGGTAGGTNANGGNVVLQGGTAAGTGVQGQVMIGAGGFTASSSTAQHLNANATITGVDSNSTIYIDNNATASIGGGWIATIPAPINSYTGRLLYIQVGGILGSAPNNVINIAPSGSSSFSMNANSVVALVWNAGMSAWLNAGSSSSSGSFIQNQNAIDQASANFRISGVGQATGGFLAPSVDVATSGALSIGTNTTTLATSIQIGATASLGAGGTTQALTVGGLNATGTQNVTIGSASGATAGATTVQSKGNTTIATNGTTRATFDTAGALTLGNGIAQAGTGSFTVQGTSTTGAATGWGVTLQGGANTNATSNALNRGGDVTLQGGVAGTGAVNGQVIIGSAAGFTTAGQQTFTTTGGSVTQSNIDTYSSIEIRGNSATILSETIPAPTNAYNGRLLYVQVTTLSGGATSIKLQPVNGSLLTLSQNSGVTLVWSTTAAGWLNAGNDSGSNNYIQNQNSADQTGNFRISGVGQANTGFLGPNLDVVTAGTLGIGTNATTVATTIQIGSTTLASGQIINIGNNATGSSTDTITVGNLLGSSATTIQGGASGSVGVQVGDGGTINVGTATTSNTIQIGSSAVASGKTQTINIGNTSGASTGTTNVVIGAGGTAAGGTTQIQSKGNTTIATNGTTRAVFDNGASTAGSLTLGSGLTGPVGTFTIQGTTGTAGVAGSNLTVQGGNSGTGAFNGGDLTLQGGATGGTGVNGTVKIGDTGFITAGAQNFTANANVTQANVDNFSSVEITSTGTGPWTATVPAPASAYNGRLLYIQVGSIGAPATSINIVTSTGVTINMKANTAVTLIWNAAQAKWLNAGADGGSNNYIQNQTAAVQTADYKISGVGQANTGFIGPSLDVATAGTLSIGTNATTVATTIQIGSTTLASNQIINLGNNATGSSTDTVTIGNLLGSSATTIQGGASGSVGIQVGDGGTINVGTATTASTVQIGSNAVASGKTQNINIGNNNGAGTSNTVIGSGSQTAGAGNVTSGATAIQSKGQTLITTNGVQRATFDSTANLYLGTGTTGAAGTYVVQGTGGTAGVAGSSLSIQGGVGGTGAVNGGDLNLQGGANGGTGVNGTVKIGDAGFNTATAQNFTANAGITQSNVDNFSSIELTSTGTGPWTATVPAPASAYNGRLLYIQVGSIGAPATSLNITTSTGVTINMKANTAVTLIWNAAQAKWLNAGADGGSNNYIQNQTATPQTADYNITGVGTAASFKGSSLDVASAGTLSIGTATATTINLGNATAVATAIQIGSTALTTGTQTITIGNEGAGGGTQNIIVGASGTATGGSTTIQSKGITSFSTNGAQRAAFSAGGDTLYVGNGDATGTGTNASPLSLFTLQATSNSGTGAGEGLTIQAGNSGASANGANLKLSGGTSANGISGLVTLTTPTFQTYNGGTAVACTGTPTVCAVPQASVDQNAVVVVNAQINAMTVSLPSPSITGSTAYGRILYVTGDNLSQNFTLSINGGGSVSNLISMRANSSATLVWGPGVSGAGAWTAAGASSSTTLQAAYDNTIQNSGGAELIVSKTSNTNGLTIRDSATNSVNGALMSVQSSSAANLFGISSNVTEYAQNPGAELYDTTTPNLNAFPSTTIWTPGTMTGSAITRSTTAANVATGQGSVSVAIGSATANTGVKNVLSSALNVGLTYNVSFSALLGSGSFSDMTVDYSKDGTTANATTNCVSGQQIFTKSWTKVTCTFTVPSGANSSNALYVRQVASAARTFYIDNLSVTSSASQSYVTDGGVDSALGSNWVLNSGATVTRSTTNGNDASDSVQVSTTTSTTSGVKNNLSVTPLASVSGGTQYQYRVTTYVQTQVTALTAFTIQYNDGTTTTNCVDYNTQAVATSTTAFTKITCIIQTPINASPSSPALIFSQGDATARNTGSGSLYIDTASMTIANSTTPDVQIGSGKNGGPTTLFTLDSGTAPPIAGDNQQLLGSMYYDTSIGKIQCYQAAGWGSCGSAPDTIVTISPEYTNAVFHGTGVGTLTSDFCSGQSGININDGTSSQPTICGSTETYNFYKWTSPQPTTQFYSVYVTYQLPSTFKAFGSGSTSVKGRVSSTSNSTIAYQVYKSNGSGLTACGSAVNVATSGGVGANAWDPGIATGAADPSTCSFAANNSIVFKITMSATSTSNAYISNIGFTFSNR